MSKMGNIVVIMSESNLTYQEAIKEAGMLQWCKRCGEELAPVDSNICGTCADDLRMDDQADEADTLTNGPFYSPGDE